LPGSKRPTRTSFGAVTPGGVSTGGAAAGGDSDCGASGELRPGSGGSEDETGAAVCDDEATKSAGWGIGGALADEGDEAPTGGEEVFELSAAVTGVDISAEGFSAELSADDVAPDGELVKFSVDDVGVDSFAEGAAEDVLLPVAPGFSLVSDGAGAMFAAFEDSDDVAVAG
jgi:hypothetical protein